MDVSQKLKKSRKVHLTCIDLFAGAGGLAEGFRQAGWRILAGVDSDAAAAQTFRLNFPEAQFFEQDVSSIDPKLVLKSCHLKQGELDCLIGGPPCQSFSYNNHARSASNRRARLFRQYMRIVSELRPKTLVMENVPGMLTIGRGKIVSEIKTSLAALGYQSSIKILFAEDYGVPQTRRRVFVIATRLGWEDLLFPLGTHGPIQKPSVNANSFVHRWEPRRGQSLPSSVVVWDAIGDLPSIKDGYAKGKIVRYRRSAYTDFQKWARKSRKTVANHAGHRLSTGGIRRIQMVPEGGNWRDIPHHLLPAGMRRARKSDHTKRYGRLARTGLCCTILTKCDPHWGSYIHPLEHRTITVREAARLQTFPDRFRFCSSISKQYEQVGNAVPPLLAKRVAQAIKSHLKRRGKKLKANQYTDHKQSIHV